MGMDLRGFEEFLKLYSCRCFNINWSSTVIVTVTSNKKDLIEIKRM